MLKHRKLFKTSLKGSRTNVIEARLALKDGDHSSPISAKELRRNPVEMKLEEDSEQKLIRQDLVETSTSAYIFPVLLVEKKGGRGKRVVVN